MKLKHILTICLICLLLAVPAGAAVTDSSGNSYRTYDQIYSSSLSSSEKLALVQEMAGMTEELEEYLAWKAAGGDSTTTSSTNLTTGTGSTKVPAATLTGGSKVTTGTSSSTSSTYTAEEQAALEAQYEDYVQVMAANYDYARSTGSGGSGTEADPYLISSLADLESFRDSVNSGATTSGKYWQLTADIDMGGSSNNWVPIGTLSYYFKGTFDGNGHTLSNFYSSNNQYHNGLFYFIENAEIKNLKITNAIIEQSDTTVSSYYSGCAVLVIFAFSSEINNCDISGSITAGSYRNTAAGNPSYYAGIAGICRSTSDTIITNCIADVDISFTSTSVSSGACTATGLAGDVTDGSIISNSYSTGSLTGNHFGGIVSASGTNTVSNSVFLGSIPSNGERILFTKRSSSNTLTNNYADSSLTGFSPTGTTTVNGADVSVATYQTQTFWEDTLGWDFDTIWYWDETENLPKLQVFRGSIPPTISAVTATPTTGGQTTEYTLSTSATTTGQGGISSYQWYFSTNSGSSWDAISGATSATYTFTPGTQFAGDIWFKVVVTGADGGVTDSWDAGFTSVKITVVMAPQISGEAASPTTGPLSQTVQLSASVTGATSYQWQELISETWTNIQGATSATATVQVADSAAKTHSYRLLATNVGGTTTSSTVTYQSVAAPVISAASAAPTTGPLTQTVTLTASVTGADSYQWQELISNTWTNIQGATSASSTVQVADAAAKTHSYRLLATNVGGTTTSSTVTYQSVTAPQISAASAAPTTGPLTQTVTLTATVTGATSYQWQEQIGGTWTSIQGATAATATVQVADSAAKTHSYRLQATNVGGTTTSSTVTYQSVEVPTISSVTASPTAGPLTQTVTLTATVTGATSYQWQELSGNTWQDISGATSASSTVQVSDSAAKQHQYRLQATNVGGTATSSAVTYQSVEVPTISAVTASPASGPLSQTVQLTATVTGADSYQWQELISGTWTNIQGATAATATVQVADSQPTEHSYRILATNVGGTATSSTVTYQSSQGPIVSGAQASPTEGPFTQTVQLTATATSDYTITYQWQEYKSNTWQDISGATSASSTVQVADSVPTLHQYRLLATDVGGTTPSAVVTYQSVAVPTFSSVTATPMQGPFTQTVQLSATVTGADSYQWQELISGAWTNIQGATTASSTIQVADSAATLHNYRLQATNVGGTATSSAVTYQSIAPPVFDSVSVTPTTGAMPLSISFSASASDTSGYRWEYSTDNSVWVQMASGASGSYTFSNAGTYSVRVVATGTGGETISSSTSVSVIDYTPVFTSVEVSPTSGVVPFSVTLTAAATNSPDIVWEKKQGLSWVAVGSGSPFTLAIPYGTESGTLSFRAQATNDYGSAVSSTVTVSVGAPPRAEIVSPADGSTFGVDREVSFSAYAVSGASYSWDFGDGSSGSGQTVTHYYSAEGMYTVTLTATNEFGSARDEIRVVLVVPTGEIYLETLSVSSTGTEVEATVETEPVAGTVLWFEVSSESGQVVMRSSEIPYSGPITWEASGLPLLAGETYRVTAKSNYHGYSLPVSVTLVEAVAAPHETLGTEWENTLYREPFDVGNLLSSGIQTYGSAMGGGAVGSAVAFGSIVMFVLVGLWLRQQDVVIPLTLTLVAGWFVIGNLPGDWQPIAYTLMVVSVVAVFFYLFRKRIE